MSNPTYEVLGTLALNDPRSGFGPKIHVQMDGDAIFACFSYPGQKQDFINLMESPAGFGSTKKEAVMDLLKNANFRCHQPMWFGWGGNAGTCDEPAYTSEVHPNSLGMLLVADCARCPRHGGFDVGAAAALALMYRTTGEVEEFATAE